MYVAWQPEGATSNISKIATAYSVPENHLVKVVHHLGKIGLLKTVRGRGGGISLAKPREEIRMGDVVRMTEPGFDLVDCDAPNPCPLQGACRLKTALDAAMEGFLENLNQYTLADVTRGEFGKRALSQLPAAPPTNNHPSDPGRGSTDDGQHASDLSAKSVSR